MARRVLRTASAAAALAGALADTSCFLEGKEYVDGIVTASLPNGAFVQEPYLCQQACQDQVDSLGCSGFMWRGTPAQANALRGAIGPGGCWLVGSKAKLVDVNISEQPGRIVSGPADCGSVTTTAPSATNGTAMPALPTLPPLPTSPPAVPTSLPEGEPTEAPGNSTQNSTNATAAEGASEGSGGGGVSPWLIIVAVVLVVGVSAGVYFVACGDGKTKASKKGKKEKKEKKTRGIELERSARDIETPADQAPLLAAASAPAPAVLAPAPAAPVATAGPLVPLQAPVLQMPGFEGARQPMSYIQPQGMYSVGPIMYTTGQPAVATTYVR